MSDIDLPDTKIAPHLDLSALFQYLWEGRKIVFWMIGVFFLLGLVWFRTAPRIYDASVTLSTAPGSSTGQTGNSALSGAARLIGLSAPGTAGAEYTKFQSLLTSEILAERLASRTNLLQQMYPALWDNTTRSWKQPSGLSNAVKSGIGSLLRRPPQHGPNAQSIRGLLQGGLDQNLSLQTSLLTLNFSSTNPEFARIFLVQVHRETDNILRDAARSRSQKRIDYLQTMLQTVNAVDQRQALIQLLNQEEQTRMMIESDPNYAADLVDPPHVSPDPASPKLTKTCFLSVFFGVFAGLMLYVVLRGLGVNSATLERNPLHWLTAIKFRRH